MNYNYGPYPGVIPMNMMLTQPMMPGQHVMTAIPPGAITYQNHVSTSMYPVGYAASIRPLISTPIITGQAVLEDNAMPRASPLQLTNQNFFSSKQSTTTVFVGNILERAPDMMIKIMLQKCGNVISWKRVQGPTGKLPAFGFCEYDKPESTLRCLRLLNNFSIGEQRLLVKVDQKTTALLDEYKRKCVELRVAAVKGQFNAGDLASDTQTLPQCSDSKGENIEDTDKDDADYDREYLDARTKTEDQKVMAALKSVLKEYAKEISAPKESKNKADSKQESSKASISATSSEAVRTDGLIMDEDRKHLVNESIKQFREQFKNEDEKMRITELERNQRIADEMSRSGTSSHQLSLKPSARVANRSPAGYKRATSPASRHRDEMSALAGDMDDEDIREKRRQDRRYREREIQYQARLESWQDRERKRQAYYNMEREKEITRRKELRRSGRRVLEFLKEYDDDVMDSKYYKGTALAQRLKAREREIALDDRDRQREREEVIEIRRKLLMHNVKENVDQLLTKYLEEEISRVTKAADRVVENPSESALLDLEEGNTRFNQKSEEVDPEFSSLVKDTSPVDKTKELKRSNSPDLNQSGSRDKPVNDSASWTTVANPKGNEQRPSVFECVPLPTHDESSCVVTEPVPRSSRTESRCESPSIGITVHAPVTINPLKVSKRKALAAPVSQAFRDEDDLDNGTGYLSSDSQGGVTRASPSYRRKLLLRPLLLERPPDDAAERKRAIKMLIENIPTVRSELFAYPIDWSQIDEKMMGSRIKPWINKKIVEYIGEEESTLTDFICQKVGRNVGPEEILEDVRMVLDDEAEVFVVKMWRLIVYETEAKRNGVGSGTTAR